MRAHPTPMTAGMVAVFLIGLTTPVLADLSDVDVSLQVRWRPESDRTVLAMNETLEGAHQLRTRLDASITTESKTTGFVQIQDSRVFGQDVAGDVGGEGDLSVHQAYLHIGRLFHDSFALQAGRFEMNYGNQRILGAADWSSMGRSFDGARLSMMSGSVQVDALYAKLNERVAVQGSRDSELWGVYAHFNQANTDVFTLFDFDEQMVGEDRALERFTSGIFSGRSLDSTFDYVANAAYQFGTSAGVDISAYLATAELGITASAIPARTAIGADLQSGNDPTKTSWNAFQTDYHSFHRVRGFMDQFVGSNPEGLLDLYLSESLQPSSSWEIVAAGHWFRTDQAFASAVDGSAAQNLGAEADLRISTTQIPGATLSAGGSLFLPTEEWRGPSPDMEGWGFMQVGVELQ